MQITSLSRFSLLAALVVTSVFATAGCQGPNPPSNVAGHSGPGAPSGMPISGDGGFAHDPATNPSHVGPANAGPAGSR